MYRIYLGEGGMPRIKAAIYCRLSKEDAAKTGPESESIQNQRSMLLRYAAEHGYTVQEVYIDEDYSGADRRRPAFNQMLAAAERREFDVILAKTQSRFTRDMELVEKYLHGKFAEWGIRFIAVVDHVDTQDRAGKKARQINGLINEWYLEDLSDNVRSVLTHKRWQGDYIATFALYGYRKDPADHSRLLPDPEAAAVVRHIYALYLQGYGTARIAHILNAEGIPPPSVYRQQHGGPGPHRQRPVEPRHPAPDADQPYLRRRFRAGPPAAKSATSLPAACGCRGRNGSWCRVPMRGLSPAPTLPPYRRGWPAGAGERCKLHGLPRWDRLRWTPHWRYRIGSSPSRCVRWSPGRPRCTVILRGTTTSLSTLPGRRSSGAGPLPPSPANSTWGGMVTVWGAASRAGRAFPSPPPGKNSSRATVCWPSNTCTPSKIWLCQPLASARRR